MSIESARAYIERLKTDAGFRDRVAAAGDKEARAALVEAEGFAFSAEDINAIADELSEDELENVVGGVQMCIRGREFEMQCLVTGITIYNDGKRAYT